MAPVHRSIHLFPSSEAISFGSAEALLAADTYQKIKTAARAGDRYCHCSMYDRSRGAPLDGESSGLQVLDADAELFFGNVDAGLDCNHHIRLERPRRIAHIMDFQANPALVLGA